MIEVMAAHPIEPGMGNHTLRDAVGVLWHFGTFNMHKDAELLDDA
jgi:hypothetical protein